MLDTTKAFSSFSVDDVPAAKKFYGETLGLKVSEENGLLTLHKGAATSSSIPSRTTPQPRSRSSTSRWTTSTEQSTS